MVKIQDKWLIYHRLSTYKVIVKGILRQKIKNELFVHSSITGNAYNF